VETAINLVHEAVHHIARESDVYIDEELRCRDIEIGFYTELQNEGIRVGEQVVRAQQGMRPGLEQQREWRNHNQLVDGVMVLYRNAATLYEVGWVVQHLNDWGGLQNRWRTTKAYFLRELVQEPGAYVDQVCQVLESIDPSHFRQIVGWVGCDDFDDGIRQLRRGLNIDWNHSNLRISELERRFNIRLRGTRADAARRTMRPPN